MGKNHKTVKNGMGTAFVIDDQKYISVVMAGTNVMFERDKKGTFKGA